MFNKYMKRLDQLALASEQIIERLDIMDAQLTALTAQVTANTNLEASAVQMIQGIAAQIAAAAASNDTNALPALTAQLNTSATALAAAIQANTPAQPAGPVVSA